MLKGSKHTKEAIKKISRGKMGQQCHLGFKHTDETKGKIRLAKLGTILSEETKIKMSKAHRGRNNYRWIEDRNLVKIKQRDERDNPEYRQWRRDVWERDGFICKLKNNNCSGKINAHHILGWSYFPKLRYKIYNGITLCLAHHPKRRAEEKRLVTYFMELVPVSN